MPYDDLVGFKRTVWRAVTLIFLVVMLINLMFHIIGIYDRKNLRENFIRQSDARAEVAVNLINAVAESRPLTQNEKERIKKLWSDAKYDVIQKEFIDPLEKPLSRNSP